MADVHNTRNASPESQWERFLRSQPQHKERLEHAAHLARTGQYEQFHNLITSTLGQEVDTWKYYQELHPQPSQAGTPHAGHEQTSHNQSHAQDHGEHHSFLQQLNEGLVPGVAAIVRKPKFMEEDPEFWKLMQKEQKAWDKENKRPGWRASKEEKAAYQEKYNDFYYGKLDADADTDEGKSLEQRAREKLKKQYESDTKANGKKKSQKEIEADQKKLARYEENENKTTRTAGFFRRKQVSLRFNEDHEVGHVKQKIHSEAAARYALLKQKGLSGDELDQSYKAIMKRLEEKHWKAFAQEHPEKAAHFAKEDYKVKKVWGKKAQQYEKEKQEEFETFKKIYSDWKEAEKVQVKIATDQAMQQGWAKRNADQAAADKATQEQMAAIATPPLTPPLQPAQPPLSPSPRNQLEPPNASSTRASLLGQRSTNPEAKVPDGAHGTESSDIGKSTPTPLSSSFRKRFIATPLTKGIHTFNKATSMLQVTRDPVGAAKSYAQNFVKDQAVTMTAQFGKKVLVQFASKAIVPLLPYIGIALFIILLLIIIIIIIAVIMAIFGSSTSSSPQTIPGLTLRLSGPFQVQNSENIQYTIDATYTGTADITLSDPLPHETTFVSATGNYQLSFGSDGRNTVTWKLNDNAASGTGTKIYNFTLTIHPDAQNTLVRNKVYANATGINGGGGTTLPPNPNAGDFESLMRGQGRNVGVLGDENSFTAKVMANEPRIVRYENLIRKAYQAAIARNVNPLVLITIWGEESGYDTSGRYFAMGCGVYIGIPKDFDSQLSCSVKTWDNLMKEYETKSQNGIPVRIPSQLGKECLYDDAFLYAAERYGPVCAAYDSNDHFHSNFYKFYKQLLGQ